MVEVSFESLIDNCPSDEIIGNNLIRAYSKINNPNYKKIICSISGGADSDIVLDICAKCDIHKKIDYVWFDTGLEYQATKDHLRFLEQKYNFKIERKRAVKPIPLACRDYGTPFLSKNISEFIQRLQKHQYKWEDKSYDELSKDYPKCKAALKWWCNNWGENSRFNISRYSGLKEYIMEYPPEFNISNKCCQYAKKDVIHKVLNEGGYDLSINGMRKAEGGVRSTKYKTCFLSNMDGTDMYMPIW